MLIQFEFQYVNKMNNCYHNCKVYNFYIDAQEQGQYQINDNGLKSLRAQKSRNEMQQTQNTVFQLEDNKKQEQQKYYNQGFINIVENYLAHCSSQFVTKMLDKPQSQYWDTALSFSQQFAKIPSCLQGDLSNIIQIVTGAIKSLLQKIGKDLPNQKDQFALIIQHWKNKDYQKIIQQACEEHASKVVERMDISLKNQSSVNALSLQCEKIYKASTADKDLKNDEYWKNKYWKKGIDDALLFLEQLILAPDAHDKEVTIHHLVRRIFQNL